MSRSVSDNRVKIKVGFPVKPPQPQVIGSRNIPAVKEPHSELSSDIALDPLASSVSLYSLCDSNFSRKNSKRKAHLKDYSVSSTTTKKRDWSWVDKNVNVIGPKKDVGPQVEIVNGKIVLKESSLVVGAESGSGTLGTEDYEEVEEELHATSKYSSYTDRRKPAAWGIEETRLFFSALRQVGTEFSLMQTFFPSRTRKELKHKFIREENMRPELVKRALEAGVPLEVDPFEVLLGGDKLDLAPKTEVSCGESDPETPSTEVNGAPTFYTG